MLRSVAALTTMVALLATALTARAQGPTCAAVFAKSAATQREIDRITLIVPVYRELKNGNVQSFLESLKSPRLYSPKLEVVMVVNNNHEIAKDESSPIRIENQQTLRFLEKASREKRYPFRLKVVDLSTRGTERNMGKIRQAGVEATLKDSGVSPEKHILVHMDMDTRFDEQFFTKLETTYKETGDPDAVFFARSYELRGTPSTPMLLSHLDYKRGRLWRDMRILLSSFREGFATYQISSRASAMLEIGGFKPLERGEDTQLSVDLLGRRHLLAPSLVVRTEDRPRPDGFTGALRAEALADGVSSRKKLFPLQLLMNETLNQLSSKVSKGTLSQSEALAKFEKRAKEVLALPQVKINLDPQLSLRDAVGHTLYEETSKPGQRLYELLTSRLPADEKAYFSSLLNIELQKAKKTREMRLIHLRDLENGKTPAFVDSGELDPFIAWARFDNPEFVAFAGKASGAPLTNKIKAFFRDWLEPLTGDSILLDLAHLKAVYEGFSNLKLDPSLAPKAEARLSALSAPPVRPEDK